MIADKQFELEKLVEISQKMLVFAQASDWEKLPASENERKSVMESFFSPPAFSQQLSAHDSSQVEQVIQDVLSINDEISRLAEKERVTINTQLYSMKKKQNVLSAYLQNK